MRSSSNRSENEQVWRARVAAVAKRDGTIHEFCREHGISREALRYWQRKLCGSGRSVEVLSSSFARVEIVEPDGVKESRLPDAAWVADLIMHLTRRVR